MEDFQKLFYDEAKELLSKLEETLMLLEDDPGNMEYINEVFRIMHSLKGSGAMFGYSNLSSFTHELESLYDKIRSNEVQLNSNIISLTINAADHIMTLLDNKDGDEKLAEKTEEQKILLSKLFHNKTDDHIDDKKPTKKAFTSKKITENNKVYYIKFEPDEDILSDGTNPLYLIDELTDLGEAITILSHNKLPGFKDIEPDKCYVSWTIILSTLADLSEIIDVFIFVEENSKITIEPLSEKDLFSINNTRTTFEYLINNKPDDIESFRNIAATLESELDQTDNLPVINEIIDQPTKKEVITPYDSANALAPNTSQKKTEVAIPESTNIETVKVSSKKLDSLINLVSELVTTQARLVTIANNAKSIELSGLSEDFQHLSRQFRDIAFDMRLIPIQTLIIKFKRLVRDLSKSLNKKVKLTTEGTETELDKNIIATLSDPVMHIIRNAIDHGIETPEIRTKNNKPETGTIHLKAEYSGTSILILIEDDGAGIDTDKVLKKAIDKNFIKPTDDISTAEIYNLLLLPGFSTSDSVSNVSGRGVGMDVVNKKIGELRGEVSISSKQGKGTKILIRLPLTLSIIDGLLVGINNERFIIPLSSIIQIYQVTKIEIEDSYNNTLNIEGVQYPFIDLTNEFDKNSLQSGNHHFIIVSYHDQKVGIIVNDLLSEYQAVLKPVGKMLTNNEIFAGATILGDGKVALVIDTNKVIDFYSNRNTE